VGKRVSGTLAATGTVTKGIAKNLSGVIAAAATLVFGGGGAAGLIGSVRELSNKTLGTVREIGVAGVTKAKRLLGTARPPRRDQ
jgi:hypothetical protein